jgi:hypothetical protein
MLRVILWAACCLVLAVVVTFGLLRCYSARNFALLSVGRAWA